MEKVLSKWRQSLLSLLLFAVQLFRIPAFRETLSPQVCKGGAQGAWASPLFLTKLKPEGPKKNFVETSPPPPLLISDLDDQAFAQPSLKVWIHHCTVIHIITLTLL